MEHLKTAVKTMSKEALELAYKDASNRAKDGHELNNLEYAEKQEQLAAMIAEELLKRLL